MTGPATDLLTYVAAHTTSGAALTLLAVLAWWGGDGARAMPAVRRGEHAHAPAWRLTTFGYRRHVEDTRPPHRAKASPPVTLPMANAMTSAP